MRTCRRRVVVMRVATSAHVSRLETAAVTCACGLEAAESAVECTGDVLAAKRWWPRRRQLVRRCSLEAAATAVYVRPGNGRGGTATEVVVRCCGGVQTVNCDDVPKLCRHV